MEAGVRLADPARIDVRGTLACGSDVEIDVNCIFEGQVRLADGVRIGAHCVVRDARIGAGAVIHPYTHIEGAAVGAGAPDRPLRAAAPGRRAGRGGPHRQLRRGQEFDAGPRRQGQPPRLPGRRHGRRAGQLRRRQHHRQLRRRQQAPHGDRQRRARRQQLRAGGTGDAGRRRHHRRRLDDQQAGTRRPADPGARAPGDHRRLAAAAQGDEARLIRTCNQTHKSSVSLQPVAVIAVRFGGSGRRGGRAAGGACGLRPTSRSTTAALGAPVASTPAPRACPVATANGACARRRHHRPACTR